MDDAIAVRLLASINANRLVILCGAGLSMAPPSNLLSAARLVQHCADKYLEITGHQLDDDLINDLENLADHFRQTNEFQRVFIQQLIPWHEFRRNPNNGHEAVADFLTSGVAEYGITTNLDTLIEIAADQLGESDFCASVKTADLNRADLRNRQLIKLHGCCLIDRPNTIWCKAQLGENPISKRIERFKEWTTPNLRERDLLIVGFWSDWGYLNNILEECVSDVEPRTVILVDPSDELNLQSKAPLMWSWATSGEVEFFHVPESGSDFLDDLRRRFCAIWLVNLITRSKVMYEQIVGRAYQGQVQLNTNLTTRELYSLRRDYSGVPSTEIPNYNRNDNSHKIIGVLHLLLLEKGGQLSGSYYTWQGRKIRLIETSGQLMSFVKDKFSDESLIQYDTTVCAGAIDDAVPPNIVRSGEPGNIIRTDPTNDWITHKSLLEELLGDG